MLIFHAGNWGLVVGVVVFGVDVVVEEMIGCRGRVLSGGFLGLMIGVVS